MIFFNLKFLSYSLKNFLICLEKCLYKYLAISLNHYDSELKQ